MLAFLWGFPFLLFRPFRYLGVFHFRDYSSDAMFPCFRCCSFVSFVSVLVLSPASVSLFEFGFSIVLEVLVASHVLGGRLCQGKFMSPSVFLAAVVGPWSSSILVGIVGGFLGAKSEFAHVSFDLS